MGTLADKPWRAWIVGSLVVLVAGDGMGCGPYTIGCDPLSDHWQININDTPMVVVDHTPQIRVGESISIAVFTFDRVLCPDGDPVRSVTWQVTNPAAVALTPGTPFADSATILGLAPGETSIVAQIGFANGSSTRTSSLWAAERGSQNVVRVVP